MLKKYKIAGLLLGSALMFGLVGCADSSQKPEVNTNTVATNEVVAQEVNAYFANMPEDIYKIDQKDFVDLAKANEDMFILDIRQLEAYNEGHIKGAVSAPWGTAISDNLEKLPMDKPIMVYCYTGQTAGQTVVLLNMAGFNAKSVNLGWDLGISKVEGVNDVIETTANEFASDQVAEIKPEIKTAITEYYTGLEAAKGTTYANYKISEDDAKVLVDAKDKNTVILSVRSAEDYAKGHIPGAINIPWGKGMEQQFGELPKDKKIVVYCYTGQTAGQAAAGLRMLGYDAVSLNAGMGTPGNAPAGWGNKGFALEDADGNIQGESGDTPVESNDQDNS